MKKLLFLSIYCTLFTCQPWLVVNCFSQQYGWVNIGDHLPNTVSTVTISDIAMAGDSMWITSGYGNYQNGVPGEIYFSSDRGNTFSIQTTLYGTHAIHMLDAHNGWCGGVEGQLYQTTNGGADWVRRAFSFGGTLMDIDFPVGSDTGYCTGFTGKVKILTSSGLTSVNLQGYVSNIYSVSCIDNKHAFVAGEEIIGPITNGIFMIDQSYPGTNGIYAIDMVDTLLGWCVGSPTGAGTWDSSGCMIIKTTDGHIWEDQVNPVRGASGTLMAVNALNNLQVWTVGTSGVILHTTDGGENWFREGEGLSNEMLYGIWVVSPQEVYVTGNDRTLLKYGLLTDLEDQPTPPTEFKLEQNYPNPFNPSTKIKYTIPTPPSSSPLVKGRNEVGFVSLKVYDVLGNEIATLVDEEKPAGSYEVEFQSIVGSHQLASGVYYYQLRAGDYLETKKMILMK
jgi:photosystem II stability/assembly factor-like uncharacterized protein